jgi:hypothetical protein
MPLAFIGCGGSGQKSPGFVPLTRQPGLQIPQDSYQKPISQVAVVGGMAVSWEELRDSLAEAGGGVVLEEVVLDRELAKLLGARGLQVSEAEVEGERVRLLDMIAVDSKLSTSEADQALARIRSARGLGPTRFGQLLRRNAALRALVSSTAVVSPEERAREMELALGAKVSAVLVLMPDEKEAALVRAGLMEPPGPSAARLSALALARSIDPSARAGGRVGPIHPADPRVPATLRSALQSLAIGELSSVIAVDGGFALLIVESRTEPLTATPELEQRVEADLRERAMRLAMERLAHQIMSETSVTGMDESMRWGWDRRRQGAAE